MLLGLFGSGSACKEWFISLDSSWDGQALSCFLVRNASKRAHLLLPSLLVVSVKVREITLSWTLLQKIVGSGVWSENGEYMYVQKLLGSTLWFIKHVSFVALLWLSQFYRWGNWDSDIPLGCLGPGVLSLTSSLLGEPTCTRKSKLCILWVLNPYNNPLRQWLSYLFAY